MNTPKVLMGALVGLAAGVVIGMLIAPEKGSTLRKNLAKKSGEFADKVVDFETKLSQNSKRQRMKMMFCQVRKKELRFNISHFIIKVGYPSLFLHF